MLRAFVREFFVFGVKEARSCIFAGTFFVILLASLKLPLFGLYRYDFICLAALALQLVLVLTRVESLDELLTLCAFHVLGLVLELYKTHPLVGSWSYPEAGYLKIGWVPLYSGFMYAAVASYMCQAWRILKLELTDYPSYKISIPLCAAIYLNFFTNHFLWDVRWLLIPAVIVVFWRTRVHFTVVEQRRRMPLILSFALIGLFIWIAENIATVLGAYVYPEQQRAWRVVSSGMITSWFLLVIVSFLIVAELKHMREKRLGGSPALASRESLSSQWSAAPTMKWMVASWTALMRMDHGVAAPLGCVADTAAGRLHGQAANGADSGRASVAVDRPR